MAIPSSSIDYMFRHPLRDRSREKATSSQDFARASEALKSVVLAPLRDQQTLNVEELVARLGSNIDVLVPVLETLAAEQYISLQQTGNEGAYELRLTPLGTAYLNQKE